MFYVQYAHARTSNVHRLAAEDGVRLEDGFDPSLLTHENEAALLAILGDFPGSSPRPPGCGSRTGSRATSRTSPAGCTSGTTPAASAR